MPVSAARSAAACIYIQAHVASPHGILSVHYGIQWYTKVSIALIPVFFSSKCHEKRQVSRIKPAFQKDMKLNGISEFSVQRIVPLSDAHFPVIDSTSADTKFGADFGLLHAVHIAIQNSEFQSG